MVELVEERPRRGLTERVVTIAGPGVARPGNYIVPLGTPVRFVLDYAGAPDVEARQIVLGGPAPSVTERSVSVGVLTAAGARRTSPTRA